MKKLLIRIRNQNLSSKIFSLNYSSGRYFKKGEINNLRCIFFNPLPFLSPPGLRLNFYLPLHTSIKLSLHTSLFYEAIMTIMTALNNKTCVNNSNS